MRAEERIAVLSAIALMLLPFVHADFPYSAEWLNYADMRIVYQIDTSAITSNTANIYVTISIDPTTLQNYIDRWASYCDPDGKYDWFWITPYYVSTANQTPRRVEIVEFNNYQTFTVGSCGTVTLPTQFTVLLPNGVLDGGDTYASYQHYILAYLKYPYSEDASDNLSGMPPEEYNVIGPVSVSNTGTISFGSGDSTCTTQAERNVNIPIDLNSKTPVIFCLSVNYVYFSWSPSCVQLEMQDGTTVTFNYIGTRCYDLRDYLLSKGYSGQVTITKMLFGRSVLKWYWLAPQQLYDYIVNR